MKNLSPARKEIAETPSFVSESTDSVTGAIAPPYAMLESGDHYSIVFNLLGVRPSDVGFAMNETKRELTVMVKKEKARVRTGFFWTFGLPLNVFPSDIRAKYGSGTMEIRIPKAAMSA